MIRRREDGEELVIAGPDVAAAAAVLADAFADDVLDPEARGRVVLAATHHADGWRDGDEPAEAWRRSCEVVAGVDAWAGLLCCVMYLHRGGRLATGAGEADTVAGRQRHFGIVRFEHRLAELIYELRPTCGLRVDRPTLRGLADGWADDGERRLAREAVMLSAACDLATFVAEAKPSAVVPFPGGDLHVRRPTRRRGLVNPWPFAGQAVELPLGYAVGGERRVLDVLVTP